ncbi:hypothetical protein [Kitasatospora sp. NPDC051914]|uniref:hypothetical protein n=1 Tax=Kitasatospora sp. NPDC051914 TaxID=3154945 RepID=UPI0034146487
MERRLTPGAGGLLGATAAGLGGLAVWWFSAAYDERHRAVLVSCIDLPANTGMRLGSWAVLCCGLLALVVPLLLRFAGRVRLDPLAVVAMVAGAALLAGGAYLVWDVRQGDRVSGQRICSGAAPLTALR